MRDSPRHLFLDEALASRAYEDLSLPIGYQQTISQPCISQDDECLISDERLSEIPLQNTLEIGTGCGYQTYLLSIFSKRLQLLKELSRFKLKPYILKNLKVNNAFLSLMMVTT